MDLTVLHYTGVYCNIFYCTVITQGCCRLSDNWPVSSMAPGLGVISVKYWTEGWEMWDNKNKYCSGEITARFRITLISRVHGFVKKMLSYSETKITKRGTLKMPS